jgi:hypothetical protein
VPNNERLSGTRMENSCAKCNEKNEPRDKKPQRLIQRNKSVSLDLLKEDRNDGSQSRRAISAGVKLTSVVVSEGVNESRSSRPKGGGLCVVVRARFQVLLT